ncbi:MAG TPA: ABC transporter ATP-binding protein, partial [Gammaproteobacteria bacterium]|nr:ABC transporter ATP-binding protein [Gammaproteobacteria bacterium]
PGEILSPEKRRVGMVFQDHALFPHLSVEQNVGSGLRTLSAPERRTTVSELLERVGLTSVAQRFPHELSGGQQQRVALARALAPRPLLLLMDEPFSSLDLDLRERMGQEVADMLKANGITCILVTHDQNDAFAMGDKVGVMADGRLLQWDTAYNLYHEPHRLQLPGGLQAKTHERKFATGHAPIPGSPPEHSPIVRETRHGRADKRRDKGRRPSV